MWKDSIIELENLGVEDNPKLVFQPTFLFEKDDGGFRLFVIPRQFFIVLKMKFLYAL